VSVTAGTGVSVLTAVASGVRVCGAALVWSARALGAPVHAVTASSAAHAAQSAALLLMRASR
jgi:hypothetical protein